MIIVEFPINLELGLMKIGFLGLKIALRNRKPVTFATASSLLATASYT